MSDAEELKETAAALPPKARARSLEQRGMTTSELLKEVLRSIPAALACALAIAISAGKLLGEPWPPFLQRPELFNAVLLFILGLISLELVIERYDVFPKIKLMPELRKNMRDELSTIRTQLVQHQDVTAATLASIERLLAKELKLLTTVLVPDAKWDSTFATLAFKYVRSNVAKVLNYNCLEVGTDEAYAMWKDSVQEANRVFAMSYAVDAWGPRQRFGSERCQVGLVLEHGAGSIRRLFLYDSEEDEAITEVMRVEMERQREFCGDDNIRCLPIHTHRRTRALTSLKQELRLDSEVCDFALFQNGSSTWLYVTVLDPQRRIKGARIILDAKINRLALEVFDESFHGAKRQFLD